MSCPRFIRKGCRILCDARVRPQAECYSKGAGNDDAAKITRARIFRPPRNRQPSKCCVSSPSTRRLSQRDNISRKNACPRAAIRRPDKVLVKSELDHGGASTLSLCLVMTMPFRLWIRLLASGPLFFLGILTGIVFRDSIIATVVFLVAICLLLPLCLVGAVMGICMVRNRLYFGCPFCSAKSPLVGADKRCLWIECPACGMISGTYSRVPPLTYRIQKETEVDSSHGG